MVWLLGTHGVCLTCIGTFLALPSKSNVVNCGHSNSGVTSGHLCQSEWVLLWQTVGIVPEPCRPEPPFTCSVFWMGLQAPPSLLFPDLWKKDGVNHSSWGGRKDVGKPTAQGLVWIQLLQNVRGAFCCWFSAAKSCQTLIDSMDCRMQASLSFTSSWSLLKASVIYFYFFSKFEEIVFYIK